MSAHALLTGPVAGRAQKTSAGLSQAAAAAGRARAPAQQAALPQMFSASQSLSSAVPCARASARLAARRRVQVYAAAQRPWQTDDARLVMADGTIFTGKAFGAKGTKVSEIVFNTSLTGYQEIMSDPSYAGQTVCFTAVHIGNTGVNEDDMESAKAWLDGIVIRSLSPLVSNYRSEQDLDTFCKKHGVIGISEVDTRALTLKLRDKGAMVGCICTDPAVSDADLLAKAKGWKLDGIDMISVVTTREKYEWKQPSDAEWEFAKPIPGGPFKVVAYDFGIKKNILRRLASYGCEVTVVPAKTPAADVFAMNPDGVFLSNGPGDPSAVPYAVESTKAFIGKVPVFGICMGHQVLGQALGGRTYKMKFGHHGGNHPIRYGPTGRIEVSAQNHNYAVDVDTLPKEVEVTHINLNDGSCAGMLWAEKRAMGIQYHPEAGPGPHDSDVNFQPFVQWMADAKKKAGAKK